MVERVLCVIAIGHDTCMLATNYDEHHHQSTTTTTLLPFLTISMVR